MCILVHAVKRQPLELPLEERISNALVEVGPSITLASLSEILAFAAGGFTPMPASSVFSLFAGLTSCFCICYLVVTLNYQLLSYLTLISLPHFFFLVALAVLLDFLLQVTAFVSLIVFNCLRAEDNWIDFFPCIKIPSSDGESDEDFFFMKLLCIVFFESVVE